MGPWKMSRIHPGVLRAAEQKGHTGLKACVPWGSGVSAQYLVVLSEHTWPHGTKAYVGASASRYTAGSQPSHRGT